VCQEVKKGMEESFADRQRVLKYKFEVEHLQEKNSTLEKSVKLSESKILQYKAMLEQQNKINEQLRISLKESTVQLEKKIEEVAEYEDGYNKRINELEESLKEEKAENLQLQQELSYYQSLAENAEFYEHYPEKFTNNETELFSMDDNFDVVTEEENDYSDDELIYIQDNRKEIAKHSNLLCMLISKHQDKCFQKKSLAEQENLIFMKLLEKNISKDMVKLIRNTMKKNGKFSRLELYKLVSKGAGNKELSEFCEMAALTDGE
jgi:hypothetical protein